MNFPKNARQWEVKFEGKNLLLAIYLSSCQPQTLEKSFWTAEETERHWVQWSFVNTGLVLEIPNSPKVPLYFLEEMLY